MMMYQKTAEKHCLPNQFKCSNNRCILQVWVCDGEDDCQDRSDEPTNCANRICPSNYFLCKSGRCIPYAWKCDGDYDCPDHEDESDSCETTPGGSGPTGPIITDGQTSGPSNPNASQPIRKTHTWIMALFMFLVVLTISFILVMQQIKKKRGFFLHQRMHNVEINNPMFGEFDGDSGIEVNSLSAPHNHHSDRIGSTGGSSSSNCAATNFTNPLYEYNNQGAGDGEEETLLVSHPLA